VKALAAVILPTLMILAAASDVTSYRIPNWLTAATALLFFPMAWASAMPLNEFMYHLMGGAILFAAGLALFFLGQFGGGDSKLMAAAGLWLGTTQTVPFLYITVLAGGALAAGMLLWAMFGSKAGVWKQKVPYGLALAFGAIVAYPQSWWFKSYLGATGHG
jgi:prepilin peptidase CpaA